MVHLSQWMDVIMLQAIHGFANARHAVTVYTSIAIMLTSFQAAALPCPLTDN